MVPIWLGLVPENMKFIRAPSSDELGAEWFVKRCGLTGDMGNWEETFEACILSQGLSSLLPDFGEVRYQGKIPQCAASEQWTPWTVD